MNTAWAGTRRVPVPSRLCASRRGHGTRPVWKRALARDANLSSEGRGFGGIPLAYNVRQRTDVEALLAEVQAAGATLLKPATVTDWGGYSGYFADSDGYPWEVAWNPYWELRADGSAQLPR